MTHLFNNPRQLLQIVALIFLATTLSACAQKSAIVVPDPTPLVNIDQSTRLELDWKFDIRKNQQTKRVFSSLLPSAHGQNVIVASSSGVVTSLSIENGKKNWDVSLGEELSAGVGQDSEIAVVVSVNGKAFGINPNTGDILWDQQLYKTIFAPPLVYRGTVIIRTIEGDLVGLAAESGEILWDAIYEQPDFVVFGSPQPIGYQNTAIIGNASGRILATSLASGLESWQIYLASQRNISDVDEGDSIPVLSEGGQLIVSDRRHAVLSYDLGSGEILWQTRRPVGRRLALGTTSAVYGIDTNSRIFALSRRDGRTLWEMEDLLYRGVKNIWVIGEHLVVDDKDRYLHVLDANTGEIVGRTRLNSQVLFSGFTSIGDKLLVSLQSSEVHAYSIKSVE